jgi:hypothetical protein
MKALGRLLVLLLAAAAATALPAGGLADGPRYSLGVVEGWTGVRSPSEPVRYVALRAPGGTVVAAIDTRDGHVERDRGLRGRFGVPLVANDGTAGGVSGRGNRLALATRAPYPGRGGATTFVVLDTRSLRVRGRVRLEGSWSYDAIAPDGTTLFLTEHLRAGPRPLYRVRTLEVGTGRLRGALVDRLEGERDMGGDPITRTASAGGRWAYTLYARQGHEPFLHAIDTARRAAYCVDLRLDVAYDEQWMLRLKLRARGRLLAVTLGPETLATVDTRSWRVKAG